MSTTALICKLNSDEKYDGIPIRFDGYHEGVGQILLDNWVNNEKVFDLFNKKINCEIRCLGEDLESTEFYPPSKNKFATKFWSNFWKALKDMTIDDVENQCGNYDYVYIWNGTNWIFFSPKQERC